MAWRVTILACALGSATMLGQSGRPPARFDVVSVKVSPTQALLGYGIAPGRFTAAALPLIDLISMAYGTPRDRIVAPDWASSRYFSVEATMPSATNQDQFREMLRAMLEERFSLRVRRETRDMPVLLLVKARGDGSLGPQLLPVKKDCSTSNTCFERQSRGVLEQSGRTWEEIRLASFLSLVMNAVVLDRTGLSGGQYDVALRWQFDLTTDPDKSTDRPANIQSAIQEQLGLKVEQSRQPVEMLVVDSVSMPSAD